MAQRLPTGFLSRFHLRTSIRYCLEQMTGMPKIRSNAGGFSKRTRGTILGNFAILLDHIRQVNPKARIVVGNPVERADFVYLFDPFNNAQGSYKGKNGIELSVLASQLLEACRLEGITTVDLNRKSGFTQESVIRFKRVKKDGIYQNLPYPEYIGLPFDPGADEYPYPPEAASLPTMVCIRQIAAIRLSPICLLTR